MKSIFNYSNVFIDPKSNYSIEEVNERNYLYKLFSLLEKALGSDFLEYKFFVLFSHDPMAIPMSSNINHPKKILFWFSEESGMNPSHLSSQFKIIFKSYIHCESGNIYSNPLGYVNEFGIFGRSNISTKEITLFFSGNLNSNRRDLYRYFFFRKYPIFWFLKYFPSLVPGFFFTKFNLTNLSTAIDRVIIYFSKGFKSGLSYHRYVSYLQKSKFVICPTGFLSNETFRHIEASAFGCVLISGPLPDVSIYKDHPFLVYKSINDLENIIHRIKMGEVDEKELATKSQSFFLKRFSVSSVAARVAEICLKEG